MRVYSIPKSKLWRSLLASLVAATTSFFVMHFLFTRELSLFGAFGGLLVGVTGGLLSKLSWRQLTITSAFWGAILGPVFGFAILAILLAFSEAGM